MASTAGLVPITREFLRKFYEGYPYEDNPEEVEQLSEGLNKEIDALVEKVPSGIELKESLLLERVHKIDHNLFHNREQSEEITSTLDKDIKAFPESTHGKLKIVRDAMEESRLGIEGFQKASAAKIGDMVIEYMPQDFRGTLFKMQKERSEKNKQAALEALLASNCSVKEKYAMLWQQQMDRRKSLAAIGSASGVFKVLVTYLAGVPSVLLDFIKQINDHNGPMEEQRTKYGPPLYQLTDLANRMHISLKLVLADLQSPSPSLDNSYLETYADSLSQAATLYAEQIKRFREFLAILFDKSPFLISAEEAMKYAGVQTDEMKEQLIVSDFEIRLPVEVEGALVAWDFTVKDAMDVGFSVSFTETGGSTPLPMIPYLKTTSHQGHFYSTGPGEYLIKWDNTYSYLYRKTIKYKAECVPPVAVTVTKSELQDLETSAEEAT